MIIDIDPNGLPAFVADHADTPHLLVFSAGWCAPCKAMTPALEDIARMYDSRIVIGRIDIEAAPDLAAAHAVRAVPTLIGMVGERELRRVVGGQSKTRLSLLADDLLDAASGGHAPA